MQFLSGSSSNSIKQTFLAFSEINLRPQNSVKAVTNFMRHSVLISNISNFYFVRLFYSSKFASNKLTKNTGTQCCSTANQGTKLARCLHEFAWEVRSTIGNALRQPTSG